jgi:hypothetical protein
MADGYPGQYQSKLLNFISRQSRFVADKCDRTWREIQVASLNATQILLYPVYLLVQSSRMLTRQLRESTKKIDLPELQEFVEDENPNLSQGLPTTEIDEESAIAEILHLAENLLLPSQISSVTESCSFLINPPQPTAKVIPDIRLQPEMQFSGKTTKAQTTGEMPLSRSQTKTADLLQAITGEMPLSRSQTKTADLSLLNNALDLEAQFNTVAEIANKPQVRGIATFISARTLVLVGAENQILDILTPAQQELLEGRIIWEVANSGPQRREIAEKELKFNLGLESAAQKSQLPPIRRFWQLMAWIQSSPVAVKRNQFGESILAVKKAINASIHDNLILAQRAIAPIAELNIDRPALSPANAIDQNISELEISLHGKFDRTSHNLSFVTLLDRAAVNLEQLSPLSVSKITDALTENPPSKIDTATTNTNLSPSAKEIIENYARNIEEIIWSSVDHLLGKETAASDNTEKAVAIKYYLEQQNQKDTESTKSDRPWLNWQDLFGEPTPTVGAVPPCPPSSSAAEEPISQISTKVNPQNQKLEKLPEGRSASIPTSPYPEAIQVLLAKLKRSLLTKVEKSQPQKGSDLTVTPQNNSVPRTAETQQEIPTTPNDGQISQSPSPAVITVETGRFVATATTASIREAQNNSAGGKSEGECLETKAVSVGYIKHPLEQVLEWLDRIMLRLETIAEEIWKWVKIHFPKITKRKDKID